MQSSDAWRGIRRLLKVPGRRPLGIRRVPESSAPSAGGALYLTFDDGPEPGSTEAVLHCLERHGAKATFFVIAEKARREPALLHAIRDRGHAIGNHSLDHRYRTFFQGRRAMTRWIESAQRSLTELLGEPPVGFRPPAGIQTPELHASLRELQLSLVLWEFRFYDAVWPLRRKKLELALARAKSGSIFLLHDAQKRERLPAFLEALDDFLMNAQKRGFEFRQLRRESLS